MKSMIAVVNQTRFWGLLAGILMGVAATSASAQYGGGFGGYGGGYGGFGGGGFGGGYGGFGGGYGGIGYGGFGGFGFGAIGGVGGVNVGGYGGSYGGYPLYGAINGYNAGYGNTFGLGLVPPAYVGTGTAGLGPIGIGGINPLFGLGLSPLAIHNAVAEQSLRQPLAQNPNYLRGYNGNAVRMSLYPPGTPTTAARPNAPAVPNAPR